HVGGGWFISDWSYRYFAAYRRDDSLCRPGGAWHCRSSRGAETNTGRLSAIRQGYAATEGFLLTRRRSAWENLGYELTTNWFAGCVSDFRIGRACSRPALI